MIASVLNDPQRCEGCNQEESAGHDQGPAAKASQGGRTQAAYEDRARSDGRHDSEGDNREWDSRRIQDGEKR